MQVCVNIIVPNNLSIGNLMQLSYYQTKAMSYRLDTADEAYALLNLSGEVGELHSLVAKSMRDGVEDEAKFKELAGKELGDIMWMVAAVASDMGLSLEKLCEQNIEKLEHRKQNNTIQGSGNER
jgi:NTP pyrophosphatase (non-canonical NTP hydrolase)